MCTNQWLIIWRSSSGLSATRSIGMEASSHARVWHSPKSMKLRFRVLSDTAVSQGRPETADSWSTWRALWTSSRESLWFVVLAYFQGRQAEFQQSWQQLSRTSLFLIEKCITTKVFSSLPLTGICLFEFFYIWSTYTDKTSLWFKSSLTPRQKYTDVIPRGQETHSLDDKSYQKLCMAALLSFLGRYSCLHKDHCSFCLMQWPLQKQWQNYRRAQRHSCLQLFWESCNKLTKVKKSKDGTK